MVTRDEELKWAYLLDPCFELTNTAGKPLTDGYIEVYIAGTRNKYYCASDFAGTLHPFQIPLDSLGSNIVLANPDNAYDVYVYNRYGNLVMSRYNVTPADGGAVISNTERINELEELVVSAVTGLQGQIDDINETLENKKDKQEPYSVTLTPTQTVSAIIQNENGEMEVIYQEIDLPEEVPNVDIVSPASTLNITTHIDEETNTKTFSIDLSDLGHLEYGQYMATEDVITGANMYRIKGNLDTTLDGKIQLHKGNSYHITVRGSYVCTDINNSINTLDYIEYSTFTPFHVDVDNTITDPQNFEISYDIFKLSNDTNYYIAFAASAGKVSNLTVEIHSLSNLSILDPDFKYQEGWGIDIVSSVISVDPSILEDYVTEEEVIAIVSGVTSYATHTEVHEATVTAIEYVTGMIPELPAEEEVQFEEINLADYALASAIPDVSDFTTHEDVNDAIVTAIEYVTSIIPDAQVQSDWNQSDDTQPDYINNKPDLDIYATHDEVNTVSGQIIEVVNNVSGDIIETVNNVSGILHGEIENIPTQVQSDWDQADDTQVDYIKNKPDLSIYATHDEVVSAVSSIDLSEYATHTEVYEASVTAVQVATGLIPDSEEIEFEEINLGDYALASAIPDVSDFTTHTEVNSAIVTAVNYVTGLIPDAQVQSDWDQDDNTQVDYIKNKPDLDIYVTHEEFIEVVSAITGIGDYGQFYATAVSGAAVMARTKGTIDVTNDGKIKLTKGSSYHVTVRGRYNQTTPNNVYSNISYVEYITFNNININVDKSITESQYFEISYDLYKLNSDTDYYIFFSGLEGTVNDLFIEIHAIGSVGAGVSGGAGAEYDAGWGIQILNNVISVDPSIFNDYVTADDLVTAVPANQVQSDWIEDDTTDPAYIQNKPDEIPLVAGNNIVIVDTGNSIVISASGTDLSNYTTETDVYNAVVTGVQAATGLIPDVSDMATQTWVNNQGFLTSVPDNYATDAEVSEAIVSSVTGFVTESQVTALIPDSEEVEFEELDITQFAQVSAIPDVSNFVTESEVTALIPESEEVQFEELDITQFAQVSAIPVVTGFATKSELSDVQATIPTVQLNGNDQVTAINNHEIAGTGGTTYTAGDYISIENDEISVTGLEPLPEIVEMDALEIKAGTNIAIVTGVSDITISVTGIEIPDTSDMATKTWVGNQGYLTSIPDTYATDIEVSQAIASSVTGFLTEPEVTALIPDSEDVTFEEINIANYALASAIPDVSNFVTDTEVTTEITEAVSGKQDLLTGITDVQVVTGLPVSPTQDVLYLIVEA